MAFTDTLNKLFSQKIIVKKLPGNRLKTIDFNLRQNAPAETGYRLGRKNRYTTGYSSDPNIEQIEALRKQFYNDYELMDTDPILSSALDIYADESTAKSPTGEMLIIKTDDGQIRSVLSNLFYSILNIEFNLWSWIRSTCKFGDFFLFLDIVPTVGVIDVIPIHPVFIRRVEKEDSITFEYEGMSSLLSKKQFEMHEIAHFRMMTDTNFLPYGKSTIDGAKKEYKKLSLMEDAMLLHRIMRAPERRIFKIDVGNIAPEEVNGFIDDLANEMKKVPYMDESGQYNLRFNLQNMMEDIYLPTRGANSSTEVTTLEGLKNEGAIDDIEYTRNKMMAYLKIPKTFLGYESAGDVKTSLASEDVRFARTIERIQKIITSELYKIAYIHLKVQGFNNTQIANFELNLSAPSIIYERQKIDLLNEKVNLVSNIKDNKLFSNKFIYGTIFGLTDDQIKEEVELIIEDCKEEFRRNQIVDQGNDPLKSGKSVGTAHDIAAMHVARKQDTIEQDTIEPLFSKDERENNPGRPVKHGSYGRHKDPALGLDPFGEKEAFNSIKGETFVKSMNKLYEFKLKSILKDQVDENLTNSEENE